MEPLNASGLLRRDMIRVLTALRSGRNRTKIIACMEVFVQEPLLDWCKASEKRAEGQARGGGKEKTTTQTPPPSSEGSTDASSSSSSSSSPSSSTSSLPPAGATGLTSELLEAGAWNARRRVGRAQEKLSGANPADILESELREDAHPLVLKANCLKEVIKVARGDPRFNVRARIKPGTACDSVAHQVDCLIDLATDPNVLARQWFGLATWV